MTSEHYSSERKRDLRLLLFLPYSDSLVNISCAVFVSSQCYLFPLILEYWKRHIWLKVSKIGWYCNFDILNLIKTWQKLLPKMPLSKMSKKFCQKCRCLKSSNKKDKCCNSRVECPFQCGFFIIIWCFPWNKKLIPVLG